MSDSKERGVDSSPKQAPMTDIGLERVPVGRLVKMLTVPQLVAIMASFAAVAAAGFWFGTFGCTTQTDSLKTQVQRLERQLTLAPESLAEFLTLERLAMRGIVTNIVREIFRDSDLVDRLRVGRRIEIVEELQAVPPERLQRQLKARTVLQPFALPGSSDLRSWIEERERATGSTQHVVSDALQDIALLEDTAMEVWTPIDQRLGEYLGAPDRELIDLFANSLSDLLTQRLEARDARLVADYRSEISVFSADDG